MTLNYYKETLNLTNYQSFYVELSNFINCKSDNHGGAISCENLGSDLFVTVSLFYKCKVTNQKYGGCIYYSSQSNFTNKCLQLSHAESEDRAPSIYSDAKYLQCTDVSMDICEGNRANFMIWGNESELHSLNISNTIAHDQVSGLITRCNINNDIKFITLDNITDGNGCAITIYFCQTTTFEYSNVFNAKSLNKSFSFLMFGNGAKATISKCVFQHQNYTSNVGFLNNPITEEITIQDCIFDSDCEEKIESCTTSKITFALNPTYIFTSIPYICNIKNTNCACNAVDSHSYLKYVAIFMFSSHK